MNRICLLALFLLIGFVVKPTYGQDLSSRLSRNATISILTMGAAGPTFTMFGHTAIRLHDPENKIDIVYNFGSFDSDTPFFYVKFLYGNLNYFLSKQPFNKFKQANIAMGRSIVSQTLNLSQKQFRLLVKKLDRNSLPQNRSYKYKFFRRNCVTKVRDLLQKLMPTSLLGKVQTNVASGPTYRQMIAPYSMNRPWARLGINLMLGANADQSLSNQEQNFLPFTLHYNLTTLSNQSGKPLVKSSKTIAGSQFQKDPPIINPVDVLGAVLMIVTVLTIASLLWGWQDWWIDRILFGVAGLLGIIIAFDTFVSLRPIFHHNWNLLWALPTHLLVAIWVKTVSRTKWLRLYFWITIILNTAVLAFWTIIPQQLPLAVTPLIVSLIIRSGFRLYTNEAKVTSFRQMGHYLTSQISSLSKSIT